MACSVITVLGADVPDGSALTSWITGLARHWFFGQGKDSGPCRPLPGPPPGAAWAALAAGVPLRVNRSCILLRPDSPGRMLRMSALGLTCDALMPKARSSCGVAT